MGVSNPNLDPKQRGSHCKDTQNKDPQFIETAIWTVSLVSMEAFTVQEVSSTPLAEPAKQVSSQGDLKTANRGIDPYLSGY